MFCFSCFNFNSHIFFHERKETSIDLWFSFAFGGSSNSIPEKWEVSSGSMNDKLCSHCGSRRSDLLQCSGCGLVHYCAPTCQKSDWKKHKRSCKPFKLETVAGKGLGLVATRPISQGDLLIREKATLMLPLNSSDKVMWERIKRNIGIENNECCVGGTYLLDISVLLYSINLKLKSSISSIFHEFTISFDPFGRKRHLFM